MIGFAARNVAKGVPSRILILAGDTDGNLGDLAIVTATVETLRRIDPAVQIALVTSRPDRDRARLGIDAIARGPRGLFALARAARRADLVICGGGGLFQDDDSLVKMPYWALRIAALRLLAPRMAGFSIGAGPLAYGVSRLFARLALRALDPVSVRDAEARNALAPLTRRDVEVVPDPAFLLTAAPDEAARQLLHDARVPLDHAPLIGVAVRRWFHTRSDLIPHGYATRLGLRRGRGRREMAAFAANVAAALDRAAARSGAHMVFMPTYDTEDDAAVCRSIARRMRADHTLLRIDDPKLYKAVTGRLAVMLCGRMHAAILAAGSGTPVVGLSYNPKFSGLFAMLGQPHRWLALADCVEPSCIDRLATLLGESITAPAAHRPHTRALAARSERFLDSLLALARRAEGLDVEGRQSGREQRP